MKINMEISLKNREWKEFLFPEIFEIKKGFYNKKPLNSNNGDIPFLGATQNNNGITEFYTIKEIDKSSKVGYGKNEPLEKKIFKGNCIAVTNNGSVGHAYYQIKDFTCSHDINPLYLKNYTLNKPIAMFLIAAIEKQKVCFEYARKWRPIRMVKSKILLPVNSQGEPDYEFMEAYMRAKEQEKINAYKNYISKRIKELETAKPVVTLKEKDWAEFEIQKLFDTKIGKNVDGNKVNKETGKTAYITRKESFNGLDGFINFNEEYLTEENPVITIGNETAEPFVQNYPFFTGTKVNILLPKNELNRFSLMFVATSLRMHKSKYSYSFTINSTRLKKQKILLPINEKKKPDYEYMENYIKRLELEKLKKYLDYKEMK